MNFIHQFHIEVFDVRKWIRHITFIEGIFKVNVATVRTMQIKGKLKRRGKIVGKRRDWKKAIVKLMPGERIEFFDGV